jgi:fructosamine-3-kinase
MALEMIANTNTVLVPRPYFFGIYEKLSYLIMEYLVMDMSNNKTNISLGKGLANLHKINYKYYGDIKNKKISTNWSNYFANEMLVSKINIAKMQNAKYSLIDKTYKLIENINICLSHKPKPSFLHGDLWGGNFSSHNNKAVIYDMASYYGDREVDISMSKLFGGFNSYFYDSYNEIFPFVDDYKHRELVYNLDPIINHFNLFGGQYERQAENMLDNIFSIYGL